MNTELLKKPEQSDSQYKIRLFEGKESGEYDIT